MVNGFVISSAVNDSSGIVDRLAASVLPKFRCVLQKFRWHTPNDDDSSYHVRNVSHNHYRLVLLPEDNTECHPRLTNDLQRFCGRSCTQEAQDEDCLLWEVVGFNGVIKPVCLPQPIVTIVRTISQCERRIPGPCLHLAAH